MEKEYVTALLFKNRRAADGLNAEEELLDSAQQQSAETPNNSGAGNVTGESNSDQNIPAPSEKLLDVIRRALEVLGLDHKG